MDEAELGARATHWLERANGDEAAAFGRRLEARLETLNGELSPRDERLRLQTSLVVKALLEVCDPPWIVRLAAWSWAPSPRSVTGSGPFFLAVRDGAVVAVGLGFRHDTAFVEPGSVAVLGAHYEGDTIVPVGSSVGKGTGEEALLAWARVRRFEELLRDPSAASNEYTMHTEATLRAGRLRVRVEVAGEWAAREHQRVG